MFKRNPDAFALVLLSCLLLAPTVRPFTWIQRPPTPLIHFVTKRDVKNRLHRTVASLKQCLHLRSTRRPIERLRTQFQ